MAEGFTFAECELEYIGEEHDPSMAAEICANAEGHRSDDETEKSSEDEGREYWLG